MTPRKKRWLIFSALASVVVVLLLVVAAIVASRRIQPYLRDQTVAYLEKKFDADVKLEKLSVVLSWTSAWDVLLRKGQGSKAHVDAGPLTLRLLKHPDLPPLLAVKRLRFTADLGSLSTPLATISSVRLDGLDLHLPPKSLRSPTAPDSAPRPTSGSARGVLIDTIRADGSRLVILPKDPARDPLVFEMRTLLLRSAGTEAAMRYETELNNAKPPGLIQCKGTFGPWVSGSPSDTPLTGNYTFENADLSVFKGIAGILSSQGRFQGVLNEITVDGTTATPDFRLTLSGNRIPLETEFHAIVDGTNGNTLLEPVKAKLGKTHFTVRGGVVRNAGESGKTVDLQANIPGGRIDDFLLLAMKGPKSFMRGGFALKARVTVPPGKAQVADKLRLNGTFRLTDAYFTNTAVQEKLDDMSRRAQGQARNEDIRKVESVMSGKFEMGGGRIRFPSLAFSIPGADVSLAGEYLFRQEEMDFNGEARIDARVSEMMKTEWKRWALKAVDPFFAKQGYGTVVKFTITGTRDQPNFSRN